MEKKPTNTFFDWSGATATIVLQSRDDEGEVLESRVVAWINDTWLPENTIWKQLWQTGPEGKQQRIEEHVYAESFDGPPVVKLDKAEVHIIFSVSRLRSYWRDWIILKFRTDLIEAFPEHKILDIGAERRGDA